MSEVVSSKRRSTSLTSKAHCMGYLSRGDIGEWQPNGAMKVIDRKKNIFKLSQGEYVAVESSESKYLQSHQYGFMGTPSSHFLLLWFLTKRPWRIEHHLTDDYKSLCQNLKARKYILDELNSTV